MNVVVGSSHAGETAKQNTLDGNVTDVSLRNVSGTLFNLFTNGSGAGTTAGVIEDDNVGSPAVDTPGAGVVTLMPAGLPHGASRRGVLYDSRDAQRRHVLRVFLD